MSNVSVLGLGFRVRTAPTTRTPNASSYGNDRTPPPPTCGWVCGLGFRVGGDQGCGFRGFVGQGVQGLGFRV